MSTDAIERLGNEPGGGVNTDPLEQLSDALRGLMASARRLKGRETHRPDALSHAQYTLLFGLAREGQLSARDLACTADLSPATVTQMLDALAAAGLVERVRSELDKRVVLTSLTPHGQEVIGAKRAMYEARRREALAEFDDEQLAAATAVIERLRDMFEELAEG
jgi:DNA-binding MarR family transcriptional regulator